MLLEQALVHWVWCTVANVVIHIWSILMRIVSERFPRSNPNGKWWKRGLCRIKEHIWESVLHAKSLSTSTLTCTLQMFGNVLHAKSLSTSTRTCTLQMFKNVLHAKLCSSCKITTNIRSTLTSKMYFSQNPTTITTLLLRDVLSHNQAGTTCGASSQQIRPRIISSYRVY